MYCSIPVEVGAGVESTLSEIVSGISDFAVGDLEKYDSFRVSSFSRYSSSLSNSTLSASEASFSFWVSARPSETD